MNKQAASQDSTSFAQNMTLNSVTEWIFENIKIILTVVIGLFLLLILSFKLLAARNQNAENDFIKGDALFNQFQKNVVGNFEDAKKDLNQLDELMNRQQDLHVKFDGAIGQSLLIVDQPQLSHPYIESVLKRTKSDHLPEYKEFTEISFLIAQRDYQAALEKSEDLSKKLNREENQILYFYNKIQMAFLYEKIGTTKDQENIWLTLESLLNEVNENEKVKQVLKSGKTSLQQYLNEKINRQ